LHLPWVDPHSPWTKVFQLPFHPRHQTIADGLSLMADVRSDPLRWHSSSNTSSLCILHSVSGPDWTADADVPDPTALWEAVQCPHSRSLR
jgi:hypothetical protein